MRIINWQKALRLWFQDKVEILEYHSAFARSPSLSMQIPSVLRLKKYIKPKKNNKIRFNRQNVYLRDKHTCQYCHIIFTYKQLTLDHVIPASKGGPKTWENVVTACRPCNQTKRNRTPHQAGMPLKHKPIKPKKLAIVPFSKVIFAKHSSWLRYIGHLFKNRF